MFAGQPRWFLLSVCRRCGRHRLRRIGGGDRHGRGYASRHGTTRHRHEYRGNGGLPRSIFHPQHLDSKAQGNALAPAEIP